MNKLLIERVKFPNTQPLVQ